MRLRTRLSISCVLALLLCVGASHSPGEAAAAPAPAHFDIDCYMCIDTGSDHYFNTIAPCGVGSSDHCRKCDTSFHQNEPYCHENWQIGPCTIHELCALTRPATLAMSSALSKGRLAEAGRLLKENPRAFHVNVERGVIQLLDCSGAVQGQIAVAAWILSGFQNVATHASAGFYGDIDFRAGAKSLNFDAEVRRIPWERSGL